MDDALVFSHANGFPAGTYRVLLDALSAHFDVSAVERFGHAPAYPVGRGWPGLKAQLLDHISAHVAPKQRLWLVGHSLGGYLSVLAAHALGARVAGVVLLDSALIDGISAHVVKFGRRIGLDRHLMPLEQTLQRRTHWPDAEAVVAHFARKAAFADWEPRVLRDYAVRGTREVDGRRELAFDHQVEYRIYRTLPTRSISAAARAVQAPIGFIAGKQSREVRYIGLRHTRDVVGARLHWIDGSHLFPMERPDETARMVLSCIHDMGRERSCGAA